VNRSACHRYEVAKPKITSRNYSLSSACLSQHFGVLLEGRMDALAFKFHQTKDVKISDEIYRLAGEYGKLREPWVFRA
jgi:hypothetical protein